MDQNTSYLEILRNLLLEEEYTFRDLAMGTGKGTDSENRLEFINNLNYNEEVCNVILHEKLDNLASFFSNNPKTDYMNAIYQVREKFRSILDLKERKSN